MFTKCSLLLFMVALMPLVAAEYQEANRLRAITEVSEEDDYETERRGDTPLVQEHNRRSPMYNHQIIETSDPDDDCCTQQDCCICIIAGMCCLSIVGCGEALWYIGKALWH